MNINPNTWSCLPTAVSNVIGIKLGRFLELVGHDGSAQPYEGDYSEYRAGFHVQECLWVLDILGWSAMPFEFYPCIMPCVDGPTRPIECGPMETLMKQSSGFVCGTVKSGLGHAVTNFRGKFYNPVGCGLVHDKAAKLYDSGFSPLVYYKVSK